MTAGASSCRCELGTLQGIHIAAPVRELFRAARHPYTRGLMASIPHLGSSLGSGAPGRLAEIAGIVPSLDQEIQGCAFAERCGFATQRCGREAPVLRELARDHWVACHEAA